MGKSYPDRTNARGIWKLSDITRNKLTQGTFPKGAGRGFNAGDNNSPNVQIDTISIKTTGNATDFGDLSQNTRTSASKKTTAPHPLILMKPMEIKENR